MSLTQVTTGGIDDGSITNAKLHSSADIALSKLADSGVSAGSYGSATAIPALTINAKGIVTAASTNTVNTTTNLGLSTATDSVTVTSSTGNNAQISEASGSAAGVMSVAHHDKLDGIEASATADQTAAEIRALVESASDSNVFTDADHSKLNGIAASATNVTNTNQLTNGAGFITSADGGNAATLDSLDSTSFLRSDAADTASGDITFSGGASAVTLASGSDIRFTDTANSAWTGNTGATAKIQAHSGTLYLVGGTNGLVFREDGTDRWRVDGSGHFDPGQDSTYDIGQSDVRVRNGYFDTLYGDGSNLTGISSTNNFVSSASFNTGNGVLTLNRSGLGTVTVDLDGRFATGTIPTNNNQLSNGAGYVSSSNQQLAKAFVSFNGYNGSIRADYGVSSVSYNAEGKYQINFSPGIGSANYTAVSACSGRGNVNTANNNSMIHTTMPGNQGGTQISNPSSGSMRLVVLHPANERTQNTSYVSVIVFDT